MATGGRCQCAMAVACVCARCVSRVGRCRYTKLKGIQQQHSKNSTHSVKIGSPHATSTRNYLYCTIYSIYTVGRLPLYQIDPSRVITLHSNVSAAHLQSELPSTRSLAVVQ